ncbi:MAG: sigma-70 family RNA polymerase sigma factor [Bryobacteraceae bacterium]
MQRMGGQPLSDEELVGRFQAADAVERQRLAGELFSRYYEKVGRWCLRFTGERAAAADLAQDVFLKAFRHLQSFRGEAKFSTWLYAIVRNECFNRVSRAPKETYGEEEMLATLPDATSLSAYDQLARDASHFQLRELLQDTLDETERNVFTLHYGDDVPLEAITRLLRLDNPSGAKAYIVSARRKLAKAVQRLKARGVRP